MEQFTVVGIVLCVATILAFAMKLLRLPFVVGYILTGVVVGPSVLGVLSSSNQFEFFGKIGVTVLLFIVGLSLSPQIIKEVGKVALATGVSQVVITTLVGFFIARAFGYGSIQSVYVAIALTFSSTIIILKLLGDKGDLTKLYGKVATGFLLVQDVIATIILITVPALAQGDVVGSLQKLLITAVIVGVIIFVTARFILPEVTTFFWSNTELLFLFSVTWGVGMAALFNKLGFSIEIGALLAGITLSTSPVSWEISSRLKPLRDFFVVLFFVSLGSQLMFGNLHEILLPAVIFSLYVVVGNPLIMFFIMRFGGYERKTSFMAALTVGQISEFSLILIALAQSLGHVPSASVSMMTLVGLITITISSLSIQHSRFIMKIIDPLLIRLFPSRKGRSERVQIEDYEILLVGYDRVGVEFVQVFNRLKKTFFVVDFSPKSIERLRKEKIAHRFGDIEDVEFLDELPLKNLKLVISTVPDLNANLLLTAHIHAHHPGSLVIALAQDTAGAAKLYEAGASYVLMPHYLGAQFAADLIEKNGFHKQAFEKEKEKHQKSLYNTELKGR